MHNILIQLLGLVTFFLFIISYQVRSNKLLFFLQAVGNTCFAIHFFPFGHSGRSGKRNYLGSPQCDARKI